jgi:hypothetical protein
MAETLYSRNEIYEMAQEQWQIADETDREKTLKAISRALSAEGIKSSKVDKDGHTKLYKLPHGVMAFVRDTMFAYFLKATGRDSPLRYSAAAISDDEVKEQRGVEEDRRLQDTDEAMKGKPWPDDDGERRAEATFNKRKFEIMLEALFNEKFELHEEDLLDDIKTAQKFQDVGNGEDITRDVIAVLKRQNVASFYYNRRKPDEPNKE